MKREMRNTTLLEDLMIAFVLDFKRSMKNGSNLILCRSINKWEPILQEIVNGMKRKH